MIQVTCTEGFRLQFTLNIRPSSVVATLFDSCMAGAAQNCCCPLHVLCTPAQPCIISRHFMQSDIQRVHVCLAVTCHLHYRQNDWDFFCGNMGVAHIPK